tara:strand:- start:1897 stop:2775 length:879 start_codon:yes stop_codon:yes gene_type:complete
MDNIKNKFYYRNQLDLIQKKLITSSNFFEELNKLNKTTKLLEIGIKRVDNVNNLVLTYNNNNFDSYLIKAYVIECYDIKTNYNNLFYYGLKDKNCWNNVINLNNINNKNIYHLICMNSINNKNLVEMIENMGNDKVCYNMTFDKTKYLEKLNKHIDDFSDFINKYNLPDDFEKIINNHYDIMDELYSTQLKYNKENESLLLKIDSGNLELCKIKKNINEYSESLKETNNNINNIELKLKTRKDDNNFLDNKILNNMNDIELLKLKIDNIDYKFKLVFIFVISLLVNYYGVLS